MTYADDNARSITVLEGARAEQERINSVALEDMAAHRHHLEAATLKFDASKAIIAAIDLALDKLYAIEADNDPLDTGVDEEPAEEDPYDTAFGKSDEQQADPGRTFAHRAPLQGEEQTT